PAYVIFPQCPEGETWSDATWNNESGEGSFKDSPGVPLTQALNLVEKIASTEPVDPSRLYVAGLSMGGLGTWYAAAGQSPRFAAAIAVCGGGDPSWASRYAGVPLWAIHGGADPVVLPSRSREMVIALTQAGHHPEIRYSEYPGVGHDSWTAAFSDDETFRWLFSQSR
ncbi:MAG: prolyl oligopeptidase family serine peptidase, partial [Planctomycetota bacterium]